MINTIVIEGRLGKEANLDVRQYEASDGTKHESKEARFNICHSKRYKGKDGEVNERKYWLHCLAKGATAELIKREVKKGDTLILQGQLWGYEKENEEGKTEVVHYLQVSSFAFGSKALGNLPPEPNNNPEIPADDGDDIPF